MRCHSWWDGVWLSKMTPAQLLAIERRSFNQSVRMARIVKVYDGDTIHVVSRLDSNEDYYNYSVRLLGVDAPEIKPSHVSDERRRIEKLAATLIRDELIKLTGKHGMLEIEFGKEEKFGRLLGVPYLVRWQCGHWVRTHNLCKWLLEQGFVKPYDGGGKEQWSDAELLALIARLQGP